MRKKLLPWGITGIAALATAAAVAINAQATTGTTAATPAYGAVVVERADPGYLYRSVPGLQYMSWKDSSGTVRKRFIRSFQISRDDGSLRSRVQYHTGGSLTDTRNWKHALDTRGRRLLDTTPYAKVNTYFRSLRGESVIIDGKARMDDRGRYVARRTSTDGGVHWSNQRASIDMAGGAAWGGSEGRIYQRAIRLPDNSLVVPFYVAWGVVGGQAKFASHLLVSRDEGLHWKRAATVFKSSRNSYTESTVTRRADGRLLMISRYDVVQNGQSLAKLAYRVTNAPVNSADALASATWGPWSAVKVRGSLGYPGAVQGASPAVITMADGVLMLVYGRPRNKIAFSYNGGASWTTAHNLYDNLPTSGCTKGYRLSDGNYFPCSSLGSSGYMGIAVTSPKTAYIIGDNCHTNWGCAGDYRYRHNRSNQLWFTTVKLS